MVYQEFFDREVLELYGDDYRVILFLVHTLKVDVNKVYWWHSSSFVRAGNRVDKMDASKVLFLVDYVDPPPAKPSDMVFMVPRN